MVILREEVVLLAEADIRLVLVNHHLRGVVEVVYAQVHINMRVQEQAILVEVVLRVTVSIQVVNVQQGITGAVALV